jgi:hypothetical protein
LADKLKHKKIQTTKTPGFVPHRQGFDPAGKVHKILINKWFFSLWSAAFVVQFILLRFIFLTCHVGKAQQIGEGNRIQVVIHGLGGIYPQVTRQTFVNAVTALRIFNARDEPGTAFEQGHDFSNRYFPRWFGERVAAFGTSGTINETGLL